MQQQRPESNERGRCRLRLAGLLLTVAVVFCITCSFVLLPLPLYNMCTELLDHSQTAVCVGAVLILHMWMYIACCILADLTSGSVELVVDVLKAPKLLHNNVQVQL